MIKTNVEDSGDNFVLNDGVNNDDFDKKDIKPVEKEDDSPGSNNFEGKDRFNNTRLCLRGGFNQDLLSEIGYIS